MATTRPNPIAAPATGPPHGPAQPNQAAGAAVAASEQALVPSPQEPEEEEESFIHSHAPVAKLPVELDVTVEVREFRVRNLLALEPGQIIETRWGHGQDVPLAAGEVQLAWSEFEVIDSQLAVRLTRLA